MAAFFSFRLFLQTQPSLSQGVAEAVGESQTFVAWVGGVIGIGEVGVADRPGWGDACDEIEHSGFDSLGQFHHAIL